MDIKFYVYFLLLKEFVQYTCLIMEDFVWKLSFPSNVLICGPSGSGKTTFFQKILNEKKCWDKPIDKIVYCYGIETGNIYQLTQSHPEIIFIKGLPENLGSPLEIFSPHKNNLIVFDDLSSESQASKAFTDFMVRGTHHTNTCMISLEHFLFSEAKERRRQAPHWHQIILFRNKRNQQQIGTLARQSGIASPKFVQWAFNDATKKPYSYLLLDFRNDTPDEMRLLTNVLGESNEPVYTYV